MGDYKECAFLLSLCILGFFFIPVRINTVENDFNIFLTAHNKTYNTTEYRRRLEIFKKSLDIINLYNGARNDNVSALYGVTEFTDLIPEYFLRAFYLESVEPVIQKPFVWSPELQIPIKIDWRHKNVITDIYDQKSCGACWAFTTVENIETMNAIKTGILERLSVQQMIDCSFVNNGCSGGDTCILLEWLKFNNISVVKDEEYPLHLVTQTCKVKNTTNGIHIKAYKCENLVNNEETILKHLANVGPVIAAVNAAPWHYYIEGIIRYHCNGSAKYLNHAVQIVGYDMAGHIPYYIVRNSWGKNFGVGGYLKIAIGRNMCGIANKIVTIVV